MRGRRKAGGSGRRGVSGGSLRQAPNGLSRSVQAIGKAELERVRVSPLAALLESVEFVAGRYPRPCDGMPAEPGIGIVVVNARFSSGAVDLEVDVDLVGEVVRPGWAADRDMYGGQGACAPQHGAVLKEQFLRAQTANELDLVEVGPQEDVLEGTPHVHQPRHIAF